MYGLPRDCDLSFMKGRYLEQIRVSLHQIMFMFDDDCSITVENEFCFVSEEKIKIIVSDNRNLPPALFNLLQDEITEFNFEENGRLLLQFSSGMFLELNDDSKIYESYKITHGKNHIIV